MPLALKYKLLGSVIFVVGANSTAVPFVWKSKGEEFRSLLKENVSTTGSNENEILKSSPQEDKLKFKQINSDHLKLNDSKEINISANTINIQVNNSEVLLINSENNGQEITKQLKGVKLSVKKISKEVKKENNVSKVNEEQKEAIEKAIKELMDKKTDYEKALKIVNDYQEAKSSISNDECFKVEEQQINFCYGKVSSEKIQDLNQKQREALKEFFKSYIKLLKKTLSLQMRLEKNSEKSIEIKINNELLNREKVSKILRNLTRIRWEQEKVLLERKKKTIDPNFGWGENWESNPFSSVFDNENQWTVHMNRIIKDKKDNGKSLDYIFNEINLLIAANLLKKMDQLKIEESR